ncbi:MAG: Uma2 family endonuclease [Bryobacteraceae bacterium]
MPAVASPPEQRVLLQNTSWETYERLLAENVNQLGTRFFYDRGCLEIMVVSSGHETPNRTLAALAEAVAVETGKDLFRTGSTTFKRKDLEKGFEPDSSFYQRDIALVRGRDEIDLETDPAPELVIEVDITSSSLARFPIFAAVGVLEVWRFDGSRVAMFRLEGTHYREVDTSIVLPPLTATMATFFLEASRRQSLIEWLRSVQEWVRANR